MEDDDGLNFEVPVEALGRVGGLVERLAGSTTITWDLGTMPESDSCMLTSMTRTRRRMPNYLRMPTSAPSADKRIRLEEPEEASPLAAGDMPDPVPGPSPAAAPAPGVHFAVAGTVNQRLEAYFLCMKKLFRCRRSCRRYVAQPLRGHLPRVRQAQQWRSGAHQQRARVVPSLAQA